MKHIKSIITLLSNLAEFVLQNRIDHKHNLTHIDTLQQELTLLKLHLLPSTEILHFLIDKQTYEIKNKLNQQLKNNQLEALTLTIAIVLTDKTNGTAWEAETWKMTVRSLQEQTISPECTAHEMLFLLQRIIKQLSPGHPLTDFIRTREASRKYIIDFQIQIAEHQKCKFHDMTKMGKLWTNHARIDNARQLVIHCYNHQCLNTLLSLYKKSPYQISAGSANLKLKGLSENTRKDSQELQDSQRETKRHKSYEETSSLFEIYDSELDVTIISSDSEQLSRGRLISELNLDDDSQEIEEFQLLIEQSNKDNEFLKDNEGLFEEWQKSLASIF